MSKIIVTGGAGMIGSNLVKRLVKEGHEVFVVDNLWRGSLDYLKAENGKMVIDFETHFLNADLTITGIADKLFKKADYIFHLADLVAGIDYVFKNQGEIFRQNILINSNVINSCRKADLKGFINVGTACSFPQTMQNTFEAVLLKEEDLYPADPESAYGWSKLMGIYETELLGKETDIQVSNLIFHNVYGYPCDYSRLTGQVIPSLIRKAINHPDEEFVVWGSGMQSRAFVFIDDIVNSLILALEKGLGKGLIQIGPSESITITKIAETIVSISGKNIPLRFDLSKQEGDKARAADYSRAKEILGWEPKTGLREGLTKVYNWIYSSITG